MFVWCPSIPESGCQLRGCPLAYMFGASTGINSEETEWRAISISCKNFFLNQCTINMFKLTLVCLLSIQEMLTLPCNSCAISKLQFRRLHIPCMANLLKRLGIFVNRLKHIHRSNWQKGNSFINFLARLFLEKTRGVPIALAS